MRARLTILLAVLVLVSAAGIWQWRHPVTDLEDTRTAAAARRSPEPDRRLDLSGAHDAAALASTLNAAYRIGADRRMIEAVADLRALLGSGPVEDLARSEWTNGHWTVRCGTAEAGTLPEYPCFADALVLLDGWARRELARAPLAAGSPDGVATAQIADFLPQQALVSCDAAVVRGGLTRALIGQALTASAQLAMLLTEDRSGFADSVSIRALALLALARVADGSAHPRECCMLAWAMGYREEARALAATLPASDPLALLVRGRAQALAALVAVPKPTREARIAQLMLLARRGDVEAWLSAVEDATGPGTDGAVSAYATALAFRRFDIARVLGRALMWAALENVADAPTEPDADAATLRAFERHLMRPDAAPRGRLSGGLLAAAKRAQFYTGLVAEHEFLMHGLGSTAAVRDMQAALVRASGGPGGWFVRWHAQISDAYSGSADAVALRIAVDDAHVPAPLAFQSYDQLVARMVPASTAARAAVRSLAARADTRPGAVVDYALAVQQQVRWPALTERLLEHAARSAGLDQPDAVLLLAMMRADHTRLAAIVEDAEVDVSAALRALRVWTATDSSAAESLLPRFARLCQRAPKDWSTAHAYADLLEARGRLQDAERVVGAWLLVSDSTSDVLDPVVAATSLARLQRKQGRLADAMRSLGDADRSGQHGALREKATLLLLTGHSREAFAISEHIVERYGQLAYARTFPLLLMWRAGRYSEAARRLASADAASRYPASQVAEDFVEAFGGRHAEARAALAATRGVVPAMATRLWSISQAFARAGDVTFAAELASSASPGSGGVRGFGLANAFDILARAAGEDSAWTWLKTQHLGADTRVLLGGLLLMHGHTRSAYDLTVAGEDAAADEYAWLLRAAAWRLDGSRRDDWRNDIRAHRAKASPGIYEQLTRYVMGEVPEADVLAQAVSRKRQNEIWFFCAVRAWSEGRTEDALTWMVLCQEVESSTDGEYFWAWQRLQDWADSWRGVRLLQMGTPLAV